MPNGMYGGVEVGYVKCEVSSNVSRLLCKSKKENACVETCILFLSNISFGRYLTLFKSLSIDRHSKVVSLARWPDAFDVKHGVFTC